MAKSKTVKELTSSKYKELVYNAAGDEVKGNFVKKVCKLLAKCGLYVEETDIYDDTVARAVSEFQEMVGMNPTGILHNKTLSAMNTYADMNMTDIILGEDTVTDEVLERESLYPHFDSYFKDERFRIYRQNHKDIKIVLGNKTITKTIKDVFMRSVTVEVDTSGNPISEVYEFIARDVIESDEITDRHKYEGPESYAPADIKYNFDNLFKKKKYNTAPLASMSSDHSSGGGTSIPSSVSSTEHSSGGGESFSSSSSSGGMSF